MLNAVLATPRPRPPAKIRRASANQRGQPSPPPPYVPAIEVISSDRPENDRLGASKAARTHQCSSSETMDGVQEDWPNDFSREDLHEILQKADGLIKERANELGLTSAVARTLHRNSASLKGRHEALLARIPSSPLSPAIASPVHSASPSLSGSQTPHFYTASLSRSSLVVSADSRLLSGNSQPPTPSYRVRKISVSPTDIALLSDQNAELMQKLERLEADSAQADCAGRRKLNRLEKDIQSLKEELEKTRERSDILEENARRGFEIAAAATGKKEREEKARILRGGRQTRDPCGPKEEHEGIRDFAPGSAMVGLGLSSCNHQEYNRDLVVDDSPLPASHSGSFAQSQAPSREYDLITQLLVKFQELEETNLLITRQQVETTDRLVAVQRDAENIGKLYDLLGGQAGLDLELVVEPDETSLVSDGAKATNEPGTIRFRSLRRTLEGEVHRLSAIGGGTVKATAPKARKSVLGYFDEVLPGAQERTKTGMDASSSGVPLQTLAEPNNPPSPPLSTISDLTPHSDALRQLARIASASSQESRGSTLDHELGSGTWTLGLWGGSHHLRDTSLYDLSIPSAAEELTVAKDAPTQKAESLWIAADGIDNKEDTAMRDTRSARYKQMSQTVRRRTNMWEDGRFKGTIVGGNTSDASQAKEASSSPRQVVDETLSNFKFPSPSVYSHIRADSTGSSHGYSPEKRPQGVVGIFFLELWLWLQFVVIIGVFVWSVARQGPRKVLKRTAPG